MRVGNEWESLFGGRVKDLRQAKGWTQDELARRMTAAGYAMHQTTVAKTESGTRPTNVGEIAALAAVFEMPIAALFDDSDDAQLVLDGAALWYRVAALLSEQTTLLERLDVVNEEIHSVQKEIEDHTHRLEHRAEGDGPLPERYRALMAGNRDRINEVLDKILQAGETRGD